MEIKKRHRFARIGLWIGNGLLWLWTGAAFLMNWIGRSTVYDDSIHAAGLGEKVVLWIIGLPWWLPVLLAIATTATLIWLSLQPLRQPIAAPAPAPAPAPSPTPPSRNERPPTPIPTPVPTTPHEAEDRIFLPADVRLDELSELYKEHTKLQANEHTQKYIDKWVKVSGQLSDLSDIDGKLYVHLRYKIMREFAGMQIPDHHDMWAMFHRPRDIEVLRIAGKGHVVWFVGRLEKVSYLGTSFEDCELVVIKTLLEMDAEHTKAESQKPQ